MSGVYPFPEDLRIFVAQTSWQFAKTYASTWPHYYVVRKPYNDHQVLALATHVYRYGREGRFYSDRRRYHHEAGWVYWFMENRPAECTLVNRCLENQTYDSRLANGTLPRSKLT